MREREPPERRGGVAQPVSRLAVAERRQLLAQVCEDGRADRRDQVAAAREPLVQRRGPDSDAIRDRLHRDRVDAAGLEKVAAGGDDIGLGGAGPGGAHALSRPMRPRWVSWNELGSLRP